HLLGDVACDVPDREVPALGVDSREEDDLEEEIAELLAQMGGPAVVDRVDDLVGLLEEIAAKVLGCLLAVPGAAALAPQAVHQRDGMVEFLHSGIVRRADEGAYHPGHGRGRLTTVLVAHRRARCAHPSGMTATMSGGVAVRSIVARSGCGRLTTVLVAHRRA